MLKSIYLIGKEISQGRDPWDDILTGVKASSKELEQRRYVLPVNFNLDAQTVEIDPVAIFEYSDELSFLKKWCSLQIQGGNNKAIYLSVDAAKIEQLHKTLFGKKEDAEYGELLEALQSAGIHKNGSLPLFEILKAVMKLKNEFMEWFFEDTGEKDKFKLKKINDKLGFSKEQKIVMLTATVSSIPHGLNQTFIGDIEPYRDFLASKFFRESSVQKTNKGQNQALCYTTGEVTRDIISPDFSGRYNINKYFVQTTKNYASEFKEANYCKNYQLSTQSLQFLDRGSDFLLKNAVTTVAGIKHVVIPDFFVDSQMNIRELGQLKKELDLLFGNSTWDGIYTYLEDNTHEHIGAYAINLLAIDSDGKYFKAGNLIRDVSSLFLEQLFKTLSEVVKKYSPWLGNIYGFNLYSVYRAVPVRKKETINRALSLMQALLEQRTIDRRILFDHFRELVLCHKYRRYKAYANIKERAEKDYPFALKDAIFTYLAFMEVLQQLNLLSDSQILKDMDTTKTIGQEEEDFLHRLAYTNEQAALFYLGRVLNRVVYEQSRKGHKKNALDKLNYNGMDGQAIFRFANELFESGRHYDITNKIVWPWGEFSRRFKLDGWAMNPAEALFYILSGYSFGIRSKKEVESEY